MRGPRVGIAGSRHEAPPFGPVRGAGGAAPRLVTRAAWAPSCVTTSRSLFELSRARGPSSIRCWRPTRRPSVRLRRGFATTPMLASAGASHNAPSPRRVRWTLRACVGRRVMAVAPFMVADASRLRGVGLGLARRVDLPWPGPTLPLPTCWSGAAAGWPNGVARLGQSAYIGCAVPTTLSMGRLLRRLLREPLSFSPPNEPRRCLRGCGLRVRPGLDPARRQEDASRRAC